MSVGVNPVNGADYKSAATSGVFASTSSSWGNLFNARVQNMQKQARLNASFYTTTPGYVPGSYNYAPQIPPIINPPPAVTRRGPDAPYYDQRLTGGPVIRPDARLYTYETAPSYIRAILDFGSSSKCAAMYAQDSEYREVYNALSAGKGYKGHFMDPTSEAFAKEWSGYNAMVDVSKAKDAVLGAFVVGLDTDESQWLGASGDGDYEEQIREAVAAQLENNPDKAALVIDGDIVLVPKSMASGFVGSSVKSQMTSQNVPQGAAVTQANQSELREILSSL